MLTRRGLLVAGAAACLAAAEPIQTYRGYRIDLSKAQEARRPEIAAYVRQQIDQIEAIPMADRVKAWFRSVTIVINPEIRQPGRYGRGRLELSGAILPPDNPLLLHEMLHGYHFDHLPGGRTNPDILAAWKRRQGLGSLAAARLLPVRAGRVLRRHRLHRPARRR